jgi:hypothetical protein
MHTLTARTPTSTAFRSKAAEGFGQSSERSPSWYIACEFFAMEGSARHLGDCLLVAVVTCWDGQKAP